jgi:hypothetical protein
MGVRGVESEKDAKGEEGVKGKEGTSTKTAPPEIDVATTNELQRLPKMSSAGDCSTGLRNDDLWTKLNY